jgi:hypothetical protein
MTADTVYLGFGLEGLAPAVRGDLVARSIRICSAATGHRDRNGSTSDALRSAANRPYGVAPLRGRSLPRQSG